MPLGRSACAADQENPLQRSVPEEIWRGTSYYLVERSQHDAEARAEDRRGARRRLQRGMTSQRGNVQQVQSSKVAQAKVGRTIAQKEKMLASRQAPVAHKPAKPMIEKIRFSPAHPVRRIPVS